MRRKDREVTDSIEIENIIKSCNCCRLGFYDDGEIYIVPLNFGYEIKNEQYIFYFHGAKSGRKYDLIQKSPKVGFELDTDYQLITIDTNCKYTGEFKSIIGNGTVNFVEDIEEYNYGFNLFMNQTTKKTDWEFPEQLKNITCMFKMVVENISCKVKEVK